MAGENAWRTSQLVADWGVARGLSADGMGVADGNGYWDALTGAALCGRLGSVLVLVPHDGPAAAGGSLSDDPWCIDAFVAPRAAGISRGYVFGGEAAVPASTLRALETAAARG